MKASIGPLLSLIYSAVVGRIPIFKVRHAYLRLYLRRLASDANIQRNCQFLNGRKVSIGRRTVVNFGCLFDGRRYLITIGDDVSIGPEASILTLGHDPQSATFEDRGGSVVIGNRAWIGYRALLLPGVTIGEGAVVAAGAVVVHDVAPFTIVAGVPARTIGERNRNLVYALNYRPVFG